MTVIATADAARATRRRASSNGTPFWFTSYIGANRYTQPADEAVPGPDTIYPMAFLVEQDPSSIVGAHYHQADQFQVIVGGSGRLGRHDVASVAVHYAAAFSAYGPLAADAEGLHYFTLRNGWDPGARYMEFPDNRTHLRALPRRHREVVGEVGGPEADGLCAQRYRVTAGERVVGPHPAAGAGQFWLVLAGEMVCADATLPERSCAFVYPDGAPFVAAAGADGLDVLALQFPRRG
jgi:hypothetical protein